uniref:Uncharacterized protein n=1 Tax=Rangifer tarandus platyrhynchus TaxID=3082113 RepID=A0ACB0DZ85_RANTA|nr:unnamed protein product [Rangifer tarandus platyrhynchus]
MFCPLSAAHGGVSLQLSFRHGATTNRGANSGKTVDSGDGRNSRPTRGWRRAAPREGGMQPLGYTVKYKLCRNLETSASAAAPGGPRPGSSCTATRRLHRRARPKPAAPERPCPALVRIRRATVRPSGPPGKLRPTVAQATGGARTGRVIASRQ